MVTEMASKPATQIYAYRGSLELEQYRPCVCATTATMVKNGRIKQYWKILIQTTWNVSADSPARTKHTYVEPRQPASRLPQPTLVFAARTFLHPCDWPNPVLWLDIPEVFLLFVEIWCDIVAHECKEAGNGESFIAVSQNLEVNGFLVIEIAEKRDNGVDGNHDKDTYDAATISFCL